MQLRLNSVDPGAVKQASQRVLDWRSFAGDVKASEQRRTKLHSYATTELRDLTRDFSQRMDDDFIPRLTQSFRTLIPEIQERADSMSDLRVLELEDEFGGRLRALERYMASADNQMADLREASIDSYKRLAEFNERLDQIWADENLDNVGGWRAAIDKIRQEREESEKTPYDVFREDAFGDYDDEEADEPTAKGLTCPACKEPKGRRQPRTGFLEDLGGVIGIAPYHCSRCMVRFYRFRPRRNKRRS